MLKPGNTVDRLIDGTTNWTSLQRLSLRHLNWSIGGCLVEFVVYVFYWSAQSIDYSLGRGALLRHNIHSTTFRIESLEAACAIATFIVQIKHLPHSTTDDHDGIIIYSTNSTDRPTKQPTNWANFFVFANSFVLDYNTVHRLVFLFFCLFYH